MQVTEHNGCVGCSYEDRNCHEEPCFSCYGTKPRDNYKRATNADRIRKMSDEELAEFIKELNDCCLAGAGKVDCSMNRDCTHCKLVVLDWLKSEAEEST